MHAKVARLDLGRIEPAIVHDQVDRRRYGHLAGELRERIGDDIGAQSVIGADLDTADAQVALCVTARRNHVACTHDHRLLRDGQFGSRIEADQLGAILARIGAIGKRPAEIEVTIGDARRHECADLRLSARMRGGEAVIDDTGEQRCAVAPVIVAPRNIYVVGPVAFTIVFHHQALRDAVEFELGDLYLAELDVAACRSIDWKPGGYGAFGEDRQLAIDPLQFDHALRLDAIDHDDAEARTFLLGDDRPLEGQALVDREGIGGLRMQ